MFSKGWVMTKVGASEWIELAVSMQEGQVVVIKGMPRVGEPEK